jgi:hypothetical protein
MSNFMGNVFQFFGVLWLVVGVVLLLFVPVLGVLIVSLGIGMLMLGGLLSLPEAAFDEASDKPRSYWLKIGYLGLLPPLGFVSIAMWHWGGGRAIKNAYRSGGGYVPGRTRLPNSGSSEGNSLSSNGPKTCGSCGGSGTNGHCSRCSGGWVRGSNGALESCSAGCNYGKIRCGNCHGSGTTY